MPDRCWTPDIGGCSVGSTPVMEARCRDRRASRAGKVDVRGHTAARLQRRSSRRRDIAIALSACICSKTVAPGGGGTPSTTTLPTSPPAWPPTTLIVRIVLTRAVAAGSCGRVVHHTCRPLRRRRPPDEAVAQARAGFAIASGAAGSALAAPAPPQRHRAIFGRIRACYAADAIVHGRATTARTTLSHVAGSRIETHRGGRSRRTQVQPLRQHARSYIAWDQLPATHVREAASEQIMPLPQLHVPVQGAVHRAPHPGGSSTLNQST